MAKKQLESLQVLAGTTRQVSDSVHMLGGEQSRQHSHATYHIQGRTNLVKPDFELLVFWASH